MAFWTRKAEAVSPRGRFFPPTIGNIQIGPRNYLQKALGMEQVENCVRRIWLPVITYMVRLALLSFLRILLGRRAVSWLGAHRVCALFNNCQGLIVQSDVRKFLRASWAWRPGSCAARGPNPMQYEIQNGGNGLLFFPLGSDKFGFVCVRLEFRTCLLVTCSFSWFRFKRQIKERSGLVCSKKPVINENEASAWMDARI